MSKAPDAFRTISEVAEWLEKPTHVLRFWESKFPQVKPVKRAGGRRYYRPEDMQLLGGIKTLLHDDGMTIKGVQKLLREQGIKHVSAFSPPLDDAPLPPQLVQDEAAAALAEEASLPTAASGEDTVVPFHRETAPIRAIAQPGSASVWGTEGRRFKSC
jgi:DNA-binding transcriptional MerR regulator